MSAIKVRARLVPKEWADNGRGTWFYGDDYMRSISKASAEALCNPHPLPRLGHETVVASTRVQGFWVELVVQNISGSFMLACCNERVANWPERFNVEVAS